MFFKYISVGVINTLLTLIVTFFCYKILNIDYRISYAIGFFIGFLNSLVLNNIYTFKEKKNNFDFQYIIKFSIFFIFAFVVSEVVLIIMVEILHYYELASIVMSMVVYTLLSYLLFNKFVFQKKSTEKKIILGKRKR